jgi:hypothetical protein
MISCKDGAEQPGLLIQKECTEAYYDHCIVDSIDAPYRLFVQGIIAILATTRGSKGSFEGSLICSDIAAVAERN